MNDVDRIGETHLVLNGWEVVEIINLLEQEGDLTEKEIQQIRRELPLIIEKAEVAAVTAVAEHFDDTRNEGDERVDELAEPDGGGD